MSLTKSTIEYPNDPRNRDAALGGPIYFVFEEAKAEEHVTFGRVFRKLLRGTHKIIISMIVMILLTTGVLLILPKVYRAQALISPAAENSVGEGPSSTLSSLAGLAGINLGSKGGVPEFARFEKTVFSYKLSQRLMDRYHIERQLFPGWDEASQRWVEPTGTWAEIRKSYRRFFNLPGWAPPNLSDVVEYMNQNFQVLKLDELSFRIMVFNHPDPEFAKNLIGWVISENDQIIKEEVNARESAYANYLRGRMRAEVISEYRLSLAAMLASVERRLMTIGVDQLYSVRIDDGPFVPDRQNTPRPSLALVGGAVMGIFIGMAIVLAGKERRPRRRDRGENATLIPAPAAE